MRLSVQHAAAVAPRQRWQYSNCIQHSPQVRQYCRALSAYGLVKRDRMTSTDRQHHEKHAQWTVDTLAGEPSLVYRGRLSLDELLSEMKSARLHLQR